MRRASESNPMRTFGRSWNCIVVRFVKTLRHDTTYQVINFLESAAGGFHTEEPCQWNEASVHDTPDPEVVASDVAQANRRDHD